MKALSIHEEYLMEIYSGDKVEEYRNYSTKHRGDLLLCVTATPQRHGYAACVVNVIGCEQLTAEEGGGYAWILETNPETGRVIGNFIYPFRVKGQQRMFEVDDTLIKYDTRTDITDEQTHNEMLDFYNSISKKKTI